ERPDQVWLTDITEHWTDEGKLYCCAIKDVCSQRIVGYSIADRMTAQLAVAALDNAAARRHTVGVIVHSDRVRAVPFPSLHVASQALPDGRLDGPRRRMRRQRRDGIVLLAAPKERPRPATLANARPTPLRNRELDRADLPSPTP